MIWDPDMVPLHPVKLFQQKTPGDPLKTLVNIGGANAPGYFSSYSKMFGRRSPPLPPLSTLLLPRLLSPTYTPPIKGVCFRSLGFEVGVFPCTIEDTPDQPIEI